MAEEDDFNMRDKFYPDVMQQQQKKVVPNPVMMRNAASTGRINGHGYGEVVAPPPPNEARARAVNRLLRLLAEAQTNSKKASYISKKFLGALAKSNAIPTYPKALGLPSNIQYKGSMAIPLPGKRAFGPGVFDGEGSNSWIYNYDDDADEQDSVDDEDEDATLWGTF